MKSAKIDIILSLICGASVAWIALDLFSKYAGNFAWILLVIFPVLFALAMFVSNLIGKKFLWISQAVKFCLAGGFADVVDIKVFQFLFWVAHFSITWKTVSFFVGTLVKYWLDKHWTFQKHELNELHKEMLKFLTVAVIGAGINVVSFYFFTKIKTGFSFYIWQEISIILAAITAAVWNFLGYKFLVFKK